MCVCVCVYIYIYIYIYVCVCVYSYHLELLENLEYFFHILLSIHSTDFKVVKIAKLTGYG